jgi:hypothetical protein
MFDTLDYPAHSLAMERVRTAYAYAHNCGIFARVTVFPDNSPGAECPEIDGEVSSCGHLGK